MSRLVLLEAPLRITAREMEKRSAFSRGYQTTAYFCAFRPEVLEMHIFAISTEAQAWQLDQREEEEEAYEGQQRTQSSPHGLRPLYEWPAGTAAGWATRCALPRDNEDARQRVEQAAPGGEASQWRRVGHNETLRSLICCTSPAESIEMCWFVCVSGAGLMNWGDSNTPQTGSLVHVLLTFFLLHAEVLGRGGAGQGALHARAGEVPEDRSLQAFQKEGPREAERQEDQGRWVWLKRQMVKPVRRENRFRAGVIRNVYVNALVIHPGSLCSCLHMCSGWCWRFCANKKNFSMCNIWIVFHLSWQTHDGCADIQKKVIILS